MNITTEGIGNFIVIFGLCVIVFGIIWLLIRLISDKTFINTTAKVIGFKEQHQSANNVKFTLYTPIIRFMSESGETETTFMDFVPKAVLNYEIDQQLEIMYKPSNPKKCFLSKDLKSRPMEAFSAVIIGLVMIGIGLYVRTLTI